MLPTQDPRNNPAHFACCWRKLQQKYLSDLKPYLSPARRRLIDLIPLYFHLEYARLPGSPIPAPAPYGIPDYAPDPALTRWLGSKASIEASSDQTPDLLGLHLMGSITSPLVFCPESDIDVWLCHRLGHAPAVSRLRDKADHLERWAAQQDIELHIYLVDTERFSHGDNGIATMDSCGSGQQHLLLDEFYRSAICLAGAMPLWWLGLEACDNSLDDATLHRHFPYAGSLMMLGGLALETPQEFFNGLLWQLNKAVDKPEKSLLKLLLTEIYTKEYPAPQWVCQRRKAIILEAMQNGAANIPQEADPYLLMFRKVEKDLADHPERQHHARICFYLKLLAAARPHGSRAHPAGHLIKMLKDEWQWPETLCKHLHESSHWQLENWQIMLAPLQSELIAAQERILDEMTRFIHPDLHTDEAALMNRLRASVRHGDHKIERIQWQIWSQHQIDRTRIIIQNVGHHKEWQLSLQNEFGRSLLERRHHSLIYLLGWLVINGFWDSQTPPDRLQTGTGRSYTSQLNSILRRIEVCWRDAASRASLLEAYRRPPEIVSRLLLVQPASDFSLPGDRHAIHDCTHTLAGQRQLNPAIIGPSELLSVNNWGEAHVYCANGSTDLLAMLANHHAAPILCPLEVLGFGPVYTPALVVATQHWLLETFSSGECHHE